VQMEAEFRDDLMERYIVTRDLMGDLRRLLDCRDWWRLADPSANYVLPTGLALCLLNKLGTPSV
jgi:hypothetical protein